MLVTLVISILLYRYVKGTKKLAHGFVHASVVDVGYLWWETNCSN
jgi:hypothetical protein